MSRVEYLSVKEGKKVNIDNFPNFHKSGSSRGMKERFYGKDALLVRCGDYIYNVTSKPSIYQLAGGKVKTNIVHVESVGDFIITGNNEDIPITFVLEEDSEKNWYLNHEVQRSDTFLKGDYGLPLDIDVINEWARQLPDLRKRVEVAKMGNKFLSKKKKIVPRKKLKYADFWKVKDY